MHITPLFHILYHQQVTHRKKSHFNSSISLRTITLSRPNSSHSKKSTFSGILPANFRKNSENFESHFWPSGGGRRPVTPAGAKKVKKKFLRKIFWWSWTRTPQRYPYPTPLASRKITENHVSNTVFRSRYCAFTLTSGSLLVSRGTLRKQYTPHKITLLLPS